MNKFFFNIFVVFLVLIIFGANLVMAQTAEDYLREGNDSFKVRNWDQAIFEYSKALEINPHFAQVYNNRGVAYGEEGTMKRAIDDFTMAIANNLNDAQAYNNRGHAYAIQGNLTQALADYSRAIDINPLYTKAIQNRAIIFYNLKEYDKAWSDIFKVEEIGGQVDHDFYQQLKKASDNASFSK